jgi:hypothetical protein
MRKRIRRAVQFAVAYAGFNCLLWAGLSGPLSVSVIQQQADVVAVATLEGVTAETKLVMHAQLRISGTIKGRVVRLLVTADLVPSQMMATNAPEPRYLVPTKLIGTTGLWFLKESGGVYEVLPLASGDYTWGEVFLPLPSSELPDPTTMIPNMVASADTTTKLVWAALLYSYQSSPSRTEDILMASLYNSRRSEALAVVEALISSQSTEVRIIGLAAGVDLGSDDALAVLAREAPTLQTHPKFPRITGALLMGYKPNGESSIAPLRKLTALHLNSIRFDEAVASALSKIGTKAVLPAMVELLDSPDRNARLRAARFFGEYTLFADAKGDMPNPNNLRPVGPWANSATRLHIPSSSSPMTADEYASFWKTWWNQNRAKIGFTED